jgi:hypothetical protein
MLGEGGRSEDWDVEDRGGGALNTEGRTRGRGRMVILLVTMGIEGGVGCRGCGREEGCAGYVYGAEGEVEVVNGSVLRCQRWEIGCRRIEGMEGRREREGGEEWRAWKLAASESTITLIFRYPYTRPAHGEFVIICDLSVFGTGGGLCKVSENRLFLGNMADLWRKDDDWEALYCSAL